MEDIQNTFLNKNYLDRWYHNYRKLEEFCNNRGSSSGRLETELVDWLEHQQSIRHMLPKELSQQLAKLPVGLEELKGSWGYMKSQLSEFVQQNGHAFVPVDQEHEILRDWLTRQVINKRLLTDIQVQQLDMLNVDWDMAVSRDQRWELMYQRLQEFYQAYGHCRVPQKWSNDPQLALWVQVQRRMYTQEKLREDRKKRLNELNFVWNVKTIFDSQWKEHFLELKSFYKKHGHCRVPGKHTKLVGWMERQRSAKANKQLPAEREKMLEEIGFIWDFKPIKKKIWEEKYRLLVEYYQKNGHSFVPVNYPENKSLGTWVATQRLLEAKGKLGQSKKNKLNALKFVWSRDTEKQLKAIQNKKWEASFEKLRVYYEKYGTCQVSLQVDPVLQRWTCWQRKAFYEGKLSKDRLDRLNEISFPWSIQEGYWMKMYDALMEFKKRFGHTRVPFQWSENHKLADWVYRMKVNKKNLSIQKVELLNRIDFDWSLSRRNVIPWNEMYRRLLAFRRKQGHTKVPVKWEEDLKLGKWASRMRSEKEKLDPRRVALLEAVGFNWGYRFARKRRNTATQGYLQEEGDFQ
jgi:hypothetical protein